MNWLIFIAGLYGQDYDYLDSEGKVNKIYESYNCSNGWINSVVECFFSENFSENTKELANQIDFDPNIDFVCSITKIYDNMYGVVFSDYENEKYDDLVQQFIDSTKQDGMLWITEKELWEKCLEALKISGFSEEEIGAESIKGILLF